MITAPWLLPRRFWHPVTALRDARHSAAGRTVSKFFEARRTAAQQREKYRQVRDEIARMPDDIALDLGICAGDADELARRAVYGD